MNVNTENYHPGSFLSAVGAAIPSLNFIGSTSTRAIPVLSSGVRGLSERRRKMYSISEQTRKDIERLEESNQRADEVARIKEVLKPILRQVMTEESESLENFFAALFELAIDQDL
ncbi:hypothetical protein LCGC14_2133790 [marine sediment metagenome]|uniref:Uncharacterized protein n=1 Tax=marine sediment metagenome TaxID=412755 RepID=A0A0F9E0N8_9ZZZZ